MFRRRLARQPWTQGSEDAIEDHSLLLTQEKASILLTLSATSASSSRWNPRTATRATISWASSRRTCARRSSRHCDFLPTCSSSSNFDAALEIRRATCGGSRFRLRELDDEEGALPPPWSSDDEDGELTRISPSRVEPTDPRPPGDQAPGTGTR